MSSLVFFFFFKLFYLFILMSSKDEWYSITVSVVRIKSPYKRPYKYKADMKDLNCPSHDYE